MVTDAKLTARESWQEALAAASERDTSLTTISGDPIDPLYLPDEPSEAYERDIGYPGQYPFTRGIHANLYRGRLWTMRQFAGFGTPEETNARFRFLLEKGQTGLSTAFDLPTLMGLDSDHPTALGEVGRLGVAVDTLDDMERLFAGINLGDVSVSMTINAPACIVLSFYLATAARQGVDWKRLRGTLQNDILKEYHAQNEFVFPPRESVRLVTDTIEFCAAKYRNSIRCRSRAITFARRAAPPPRSWPSRWPTVFITLSKRSSADWRSTTSPRDCRSFSTRTATFSKRSPSSAPRGAFGPAICASVTAPRSRAVGSCDSTADFRRQLAGAAAGSKRDPRRVSGDGRSLGGLPIAAHQQPRRNAVAADRRGRDDRAVARNKCWPSRPASSTRSTRSAAVTRSRR